MFAKIKKRREATKQEAKKKKEEEDKKKDKCPVTPMTGYFRDGIRRIDMILVLKCCCLVSMRKFIIELVKMGFALEIEAGKMVIHRHLLFLKLHASDIVIERYGEIFFFTKYFNDMHMEMIPGDVYCYPLRLIMSHIPFATMSHEKAYLGIIRSNYPSPRHYSTLDRSRVVYELLKNTNFRAGKYVTDMYALHDGPFFLLEDQVFLEATGRQILYEFWTGFNNIVRVQPLYIINEYFGERIGFFFAFYGYYNMFLIPLALAGLLTMLYDIFQVSDSDVSNYFCSTMAATYYPIGSMDVWRTTANDSWDHVHWERKEHMYYINYRSYPLQLTTSGWVKNIWFCPNCRHYRICPYRREFELCDESRMNDILETSAKLYYLPVFCFFWAAFFLKFWKRTENFYNFMWEVDNEYIKNTLRAHRLGINVNLRTGLCTRIWNSIWNILLLGICLLSALIMLYYLLHYRYYLMYVLLEVIKNDTERKYYVTLFLGMINMTIVFILERISHFFVHRMVHLERLQTTQQKEEAVTLRLFGISFIFTFIPITYVAFGKGQLYTTPIDRRNLKFLGGILMDNCNPLTCMDEVLVLIIAILFMREFVFRFMPYIKMVNPTSDYSIKCWYNDLPYWERERFMYKDRDTYDFLRLKYKDIVMQFATTILFIGVCPIAPVIALFVNALDIRYCARRFLLHTRRPLIRRSVGIGMWRDILVFLVFLMGLFGTMLVTVTSDFILRTNTDLKLDTNVYDHVDFQREHITYPLYTQVNGMQGDVGIVSKIGHIPLAAFPEYDYLIIYPNFYTTEHNRPDDPGLYKDFQRYVMYTISDFRSPCYGWYDGCRFLSKIRVGCLWRTLWGETFPPNSTFKKANCTLVYDTTVRRHCYMKGFLRRIASVTRSATKMYSEEISIKGTTSTVTYTDEHTAHRYVTTWSTTSEFVADVTYTWSTIWQNITTSWFHTSLFRSWYFSWFEDMAPTDPTSTLLSYLSIQTNSLSRLNWFMGTNFTAFYRTSWIFIPWWATSALTSKWWATAYYWSWLKNASDTWSHSYSETFTTDTWKFTLEYYADMFHAYGYAKNWQQIYIAHQKWWYTVVTATILTILFIMIYSWWPDTTYEISELTAMEKNIEVTTFPKMKCE